MGIIENDNKNAYEKVNCSFAPKIVKWNCKSVYQSKFAENGLKKEVITR